MRWPPMISPVNPGLMLTAPFDRLKAQGVKSVASIALATAFGDAFVAAAKAEEHIGT